MNNFKDYNNLSLNMHDNAYAMFLRQQELNKVLLEKKLAKEKKSQKKADKDYDGDGKIESKKDEYFGSKDKAIKKAIAAKKGKKINEMMDDWIHPEFFERPGQHATERFNDGNDPNQKNVATGTDQEELWADESLVHLGMRYPSRALMDLAQTQDALHHEYLTKRRESRTFEDSPEGKELGKKAYDARMAYLSHPHYDEFRKGHPSKRIRLIRSATYAPGTVIDSSREGT